jgi:tricorn protease interacting factor F2/3
MIETIRAPPSLGVTVLQYDVALIIDYPSGEFRGNIGVTGLAGPGPIELDSVDLSIERVEIGGVPVPFEIDVKKGKLIFHPTDSAPAEVRISFSGKAADGVQTGFFACKLGAERALTTQMEPESCRRLIPCIDRPDEKAVFRLKVTIPTDLMAISNMPGVARPLGDGKSEWTFMSTPPMSSYLLYLGVGAFEETIDDDGPIRVVVAGPPGKRPQASRTARIARQVLRGYTDYFDIPYPLPKLHLVALSDFWAAMENWGAISGSEEHYLLDDTATPVTLRFAEETIVHEIAHQWFGNLVTLRTWDDLWLNESFATFAVPLIQELAHLRPDPWGEFVMRTAGGDRYDSLWSSHPVKPDSYIAAEIMANADAITYFKGARLVRMIEAFLGHERFRDGISEYLRDHEYGNARSDDLWETLEEESRLPVARVMRTWVERPGHPCITVRQAGPDIELTQRRFTFVPREASEPPWPIPLTWTNGPEKRTVVFDSERLSLGRQDPETLSIDPGRAGFFRVLWAPELRPRIIGRLGVLPSLDRCAFVHDAFGFLLSGDYSLDDYIAVLTAATSATDPITVEEVGRSLDALQPILWDVPQFLQVARSFCRTQNERLGEKPAAGESAASDVAREWIFWERARLEPEFAGTLASRFATISREPRVTRQAIAIAFARQGDSDAADRLLAMASGTDSDAASIAAFAFGEFPNVDLLMPALDKAISSVRLSNLLAFLIPSVSRNPPARPAVWDWLTRNFRKFERMAAGSYLFATMAERTLLYVGIGRSSEVRAFFARESFPTGLPGIRMGLELLEANERLRARVVDHRPS